MVKFFEAVYIIKFTKEKAMVKDMPGCSTNSWVRGILGYLIGTMNGLVN